MLSLRSSQSALHSLAYKVEHDDSASLHARLHTLLGTQMLETSKAKLAINSDTTEVAAGWLWTLAV